MESTAANRKRPASHYADQRLVMRRAWASARKAQAIYGGTVRQYIAEAMRQEWADLLANPVRQEVAAIIASIRAHRQTPGAHVIFARRAMQSGAGAWIGQ